MATSDSWKQAVIRAREVRGYIRRRRKLEPLPESSSQEVDCEDLEAAFAAQQANVDTAQANLQTAMDVLAAEEQTLMDIGQQIEEHCLGGGDPPAP